MRYGIIASNNFVLNPPRLLAITGASAESQLRHFALYWDRVLLLNVNGLGSNVDIADAHCLKDEGILETENILVHESRMRAANIPEGQMLFKGGLDKVVVANTAVNGDPDNGPIGEYLNSRHCEAVMEVDHDIRFFGFNILEMEFAHHLAARESVLRHNTHDLDTIWGICQYAPRLSIDIPGEAKVDTIALTFRNALPSPSPDAPLKKVIKFRNKRRDEFGRFRSALSELEAGIEGEQDIDKFKEMRVEIDQSLADIHKCMGESLPLAAAKTFKTFLNSSTEALASSAIGALVASSFGVSLPLTALTAVSANALLSVFVERQNRIDSLPSKVKSYAYLYHADRAGMLLKAQR